MRTTEMRYTKKYVASKMIKHASDGLRNLQPGDIVDFDDYEDDVDVDRAKRNALRWGWITADGRLLTAGWRAI